MDHYLMLAFVLTMVCAFFGIVGGFVWFAHKTWREYYRNVTRRRLGQPYETRWSE
jgi:uncharacterized protein YneF (UPF0154 family)